MYAKFRLDINETDFSNEIERYVADGNINYDKNRLVTKEKILSRKDLSNYEELDDYLDGTRIINDWFPEINSSVFISHSHKNKDIAIGLSGLLKEKFNIESFVDSALWGYAGDLMQEMHEKYCEFEKNGRKYFGYESSMRVASHVHMMLSVALTNMIDKCECIIFVNTKDSFNPPRSEGEEGEVESPWIYSELSSLNMLRTTIPPRFLTGRLVEEVLTKSLALEDRMPDIKVKYKISLDKLTELNIKEINKLLGYKELKMLDHLYEMKNFIKMKPEVGEFFNG